MSIEWTLGLLPWLVFLVCPIAMLWMMRGMHGGSCGKEQAPGSAFARGATVADDGQAVDMDTEVAQLRQRLARLEAQRARTHSVEAHS